MKSVILSIHHEFAEKIYQCTKSFELRKVLPTFEVGTRIYMYETKPVGLITGYFTYDGWEYLNPYRLWEKFGSRLGIDEDRLYNYYQSKDVACAWRIKDPTKLGTPLSLSSFGLKRAPQSYQIVQI